MSPIERAARALCKARGYNPDELCANYGPDMVPVWLVRAEDVRLMLQAIREPSEEMRDKGGFICSPCSDNPTRWRVLNRVERKLSEEYATEIWQVMIDAALTEGGGG